MRCHNFIGAPPFKTPRKPNINKLGIPGSDQIGLLPSCLMGTPFDLLNLNPDVYLDLSRRGGVTVDGSNNITDIHDLSGNGVDYYQTITNQMWDYVYDSDVKKYVGQGGTKGGLDNSFYLTSSAYVTTATDTWIFVFKDNPAGKTDAALVAAYGSGPPDNNRLMSVRVDNDSAGDIFFVRDINRDVLQLTTPIIPGWDILVCVRESGKITMHYNRTVLELTGDYLATALSPVGGTDFYNPTLGVQPDGSGGVINNTHFSGRFGLMAKFNSALPLATINWIKANLAAEWNITNY